MEKILKEIERIKNDTDPLLDKKCIGLYNTMVVFVEDGKRMNLTESFFKDKNSCFDYFYAGCYITPGRITTIREIHINALKSAIKNILVEKYFENKNFVEENKELYEKYLPKLLELKCEA